ncbi:MAG: tRNA (adenosine(37)-N6)-dimethylallyltransferase MiaA [Jiangellaceae bacterium]|nr:tRNA (adenosine(37)-N6)-dimethylallyltransferase MiaA [Jiangellaceae bacterium]
MPALRSAWGTSWRCGSGTADVTLGPVSSVRPVVAVVGPTAAGKSELAVELALRLGGEVVNADSMQIYRGMDIGTAKLTEAQRRGVPHHLLDVLDVTEPATVAEIQRLARAAIDDCLARATTPIVVGGSALYVRAVLDRFDFPGTDARVRSRLERELAAVGAEAMHARLSQRDPVAAAAILPSNARRIVRALEVVELTGRFAATLPGLQYAYPRAVQLGIAVPRDALDRRIAERVHHMWAAGLVEEVRALERAGLRRARTAPRALGYAQVLAFLAGEYSEVEARERTIRATRRFARRQESWLRRDPRICWLPGDAADLLEQALAWCR